MVVRAEGPQACGTDFQRDPRSPRAGRPSYQPKTLLSRPLRSEVKPPAARTKASAWRQAPQLCPTPPQRSPERTIPDTGPLPVLLHTCSLEIQRRAMATARAPRRGWWPRTAANAQGRELIRGLLGASLVSRVGLAGHPSPGGAAATSGWTVGRCHAGEGVLRARQPTPTARTVRTGAQELATEAYTAMAAGAPSVRQR
jgi:hypothetical protein